jgi:hypothetical protein
MNNIPDEFDWVTARADCSISSVFENLKTQVEQDVETMNGLRPPSMNYAFKLVQPSKRLFSVDTEGSGVLLRVQFKLEADKICVFSREGLMLQAFATLSNEGKCRVLIEGKEHTLWQMRKMALEDFFFRPYIA